MNKTHEDLSAYLAEVEAKELKQDTEVAKAYFDFIRQYDRDNVPIGICAFLDRNLLDEESYRIASSIVMADGGFNYASKEDVNRILGDMDNRIATRWESMRATGFANKPDAQEDPDCPDANVEIDVSRLGRYIRCMDFVNPFEEDES